MKRILFTTFAACLLALSAWANGTEIDGIYYELNSSTGTASVTYTGSNFSSGNNYLGDIIIPATVTYGGTTYSVTSIGNYAFNNCINLTSIEIPATVTAIKGRAFSGCSKLTCVTINSDPIVSKDYYDTSTLPFYELFGSQVKKYILGEGVTKIGERAFFPGFPNGTSNGNVRFMPTEIEEVYLPSTLRSIGRWAFQFCINLKHVYFQEGLDSIADGAFTYCLSLKNLNIPASLRVLGEGQSWLLACKDITVAKGNQHIVLQDSVLFDSDMTTLLQYPASRESAYYHIPEGVKKVQAWAFEGAGNLKTLIIPSSVKSMGDNWMAYTRPQEIHIENKVPPMSETRVSEDNQNIGNSLLYPSFIFYNEVVLHVPKGCKEAYASTAPWSNFASIVDDIDNSSDDAVVLTADGEDVWTDGVLRFSVSSEENSEAVVSGVKDKDNLGAVTIPEKVKIADKVYSVTSIGYYAFSDCIGLRSITIPNSVTSIRGSAFSGCPGLTSITIPNSVTSIGAGAFEGCTGLTDIYALRTDPAAYDCATDAFSDYSATLHVPAGSKEAYAGTAPWSKFANIVDDIDNSSDDAVVLTADGEDVWTDGVLRFSVSSEENGEAAVSGVKDKDNLGAVTIPEKVKIGGKVYSVTSIGYGAFTGCTGLTSIDIPNSVTSIDIYAFQGCTSLTSITIPNSVTSIGYCAFQSCKSLTSITIPNSVTSIGNYAFAGCSGLTSIEVEAGNTQYDSREACNAIIETESSTLIAGCMNTIIPNSVTSIENYTFYGCTGLTSITIPNSDTSIGSYAFDGCSGLTRITIPNSVTSIGIGAFAGCSGLTSIEVEAGNTQYDSREACNAIIETESSTLIAGCMNTIIPNSVTSIGEEAFYGCTGLTSITIPNSVTSIGRLAFAICTGLTSITIPESVTSIGNYAFAGCEGFKYINALRTDPAAYNCATDAFSDYSYSATLYVPSGSKEAYASTEPWSNFTNIEEDPIQVGGLLYTIQGNEATCVGTGSVEGWYNWPVANIPERITYDGKEYSVTAVDGGGGYGSIIVLPKTLKRIDYLSAQNKVIICLSPTPPEIESISVSSCALYVPDEYLEAHRKGWVIDGKLFGNRYSSFDVEAYPNLISYYIRPMSHLLNYVYDDETMTATINGFRLVTYNGTFTISEALGCTSSRMSSTYRERIWAEQNDINLDWVVPATITKFHYLYGNTHSRVKTGETYAVKRVEKLLGARSVTLSEGIEEVGQRAFSLDLWPVVTDAEGNAQYYNDPLESVSLPSTLKLLDWYAFCGCTSLKHVEMKEGLDSIGRGVFTYCLSLEDCHLPASLRAMGYGHGNLFSLQAFSTAQGSENIVAKDGVLFSDGGKTLLQYPAGKPDTTYEVPEGTVKLSEWSFEAVQELESIILPASVEEIGGYIFANTHCLKHIYCKSQTPPVLTNGQWWLRGGPRTDDAALSAYNIYKEVTVHVPFGCKEVYANAPAWRDFNIVEDINTGIEPLTLTPSEAGQAYYNLQGQLITNPQRGQLVIIRYADGTSRKVVVD